MSLNPADAAEINAGEPAELTILRETGWVFKKGDACKSVDGKEVRINYSRISERGKAVTVDGRVLKLGLDPGVDQELQHLFSKIDKAPKKTTPKTPEVVTPEPPKIEPPECVLLKEQGWKFDQGAFMKDIDGKSVMIVYSDIAKKGGACMIGGKPFMPEDFPVITRELQTLFKKIDEVKGIKPKAEIVRREPSNGNTPAVVASANSVLSVESILKYIAPDATEEEAFMFLQLCIARKLNPFLKEAYLIKYSKTSPAAFVVGKDAFTKRADAHPEYQGLKSGIVVKTETGTLERRKGCLMLEKETLLGGWAEILRTGREPYFSEVALSEYMQMKDGKPTRFWAVMPATMIVKVAVVQGLRGQFPQEFAGMYDRAEMPEE